MLQFPGEEPRRNCAGTMPLGVTVGPVLIPVPPLAMTTMPVTFPAVVAVDALPLKLPPKVFAVRLPLPSRTATLLAVAVVLALASMALVTPPAATATVGALALPPIVMLPSPAVTELTAPG